MSGFVSIAVTRVPDLIRDLMPVGAPDQVRGAMSCDPEGAPC